MNLSPRLSVQTASALLALSLATTSCSSFSEPKLADPAAAAKPTLSFDNIILTESDQQGQGQLWELKAKQAEYSRDRKQAVIRQIEGAFFEKGQKALLVSAPEGQIQAAERVIILKGGVKAESLAFGTRFSADMVRWLPDQNKIEASGRVILINLKQKVTVKGDQMTGDLAGDTVKLTGNISAVTTDPSVSLVATEALWQVSQERLTAQNVEATSNKGNIQAPQVIWNLKNHLVQASQGIAYQRGNITLNAQEAAWETQSQNLRAQGNVDYRHGSTRVQGEQATANLKAGTVQVKGRVTTNVETLALR